MNSTNRSRRFVRGVCACAAAGVILLAVGGLAGLRVNWTASYPLGIYRPLNTPWHKGDLVIADVPVDGSIFQAALRRGYIHAGIRKPEPILKRVVAVAGDRVDVADVVSVNGTVIPNSRLLMYDTAGRPVPHDAISGIVPAGYVWLMSDYSPQSFDSRYFGAIAAKYIRGPVRPLLVW